MSNTQRRTPKTVGEAAAAKRSNPLVAAILDADDIPYQDEEVPEWGNIKLRIRGLTGKERDRYEAQMFAVRATDDGQMKLDLLGDRNARVLAQCLFDPETDEPLPIDVDDLGAKSGVVVSRLAGIALNLSGLGRKSVDEAGKGSSSDRSEGSTSA